jgi:hypothetical protein
VQPAYRPGVVRAGRSGRWGLTMGQRRAVTKAIATRYVPADNAAKGVISGRVVRDDRLAPQPCPQGAGGRGWSVRAGRGHRGTTRRLWPRWRSVGRCSAPRTASGWCRSWASWRPDCGAWTSCRSPRRLRCCWSACRGDDGPSARSRSGQDAASRTQPHQAGFAAEVPDPDPDAADV